MPGNSKGWLASLVASELETAFDHRPNPKSDFQQTRGPARESRPGVSLDPAWELEGSEETTAGERPGLH